MTDDESKKGNSGDEWVFIAIKEDDPVTADFTSCIVEEKALAAKIKEKYEWVIDSGCSHHMICDKSKFVSMEMYDGGVVRFRDNKVGIIHGRDFISLDGKHDTDDVLYVKVLKHNLLSVG